jgi:hypothetical protein
MQSGIGDAFINIRARMDGLRGDVQRAVGIVENGNGALARSGRVLGGVLRTGALAAAAGAASLGVLATGAIRTTAQFQSLKASLVTVTGSQEAANAAFARLTQFAATTPYQLQEVVGAFTKLTAMGLNPSQEALTAYGNTASAMGKSLDQMIEAVADAATGEFERLKEFGIRAKSEGDNVSFTFQGITTTVGKNAKEIEEYLMSLGSVQFAGAMERQAETLNGVMSNLQDSVATTANAFGEGLAPALTAVIKELSGAIGGGDEAAKAFGERLGGAVTVVHQSIKGLIGEINSADGVLATELLPTLRETADTMNELGRGPLGTILLPALRDLVGYISNTLVREIATMVGWFNDLMKTLDDVSRAMTRFYVQVRFAAEQAIDAIKDLPGQFARAGRDMVDGLVNGIRDRASSLVGAVRSLGESAMSTFTRVLDIRSPSRVFFEYGGFIVQGLIDGVEQMTPELEQQMRKIARLTNDSFLEGLLTDRERGFAALNNNIADLTTRLGEGRITLQQYDLLLGRLIARDAPGAFGSIADSINRVNMAGGVGLNPIMSADFGGALAALPGGLPAKRDAANQNKLREIEQQREAFRNAFRDGVRAAMDGDLRDVAKDWVANFAARGLETALNNLSDMLMNLLSSAFRPQAGGGGFLASLGSLFGGFRANGGPVSSGKAYVVGERGPEFFMPKGSGTIIPHAANGNGGARVVNVYADGYITEQVLRRMIADAMVQTGGATQASTISTIQRRAGRAFA